MYVTCEHTPNILRADLDGANLMTLTTMGAPSAGLAPYGMALDVAGQSDHPVHVFNSYHTINRITVE